MKRNRGFTVVELMIVVAIVGILAMISISITNHYLNSRSHHGSHSQRDCSCD